MKKITLWIGLILVLLIAYFGYKGFVLLYYNVGGLTIENYETYVEQFNISNTVTIQHQEVEDNDYFEYQNMKIRNDFKEFVELDHSLSMDATSPKLVLRDEKNRMEKAFWMGATDTYVYLLKTDKTVFGTGEKRITNTDFTDMLEKNNIHTDIELFHYLEEHKNVKNSIFTSTKQMKENFAVRFIISALMPTMHSITLIDGDYEGYMFNINGNMKEVSILKDGKRYAFIFMDQTGVSDEYVTDILSTIVIE